MDTECRFIYLNPREIVTINITNQNELLSHTENTQRSTDILGNGRSEFN